MASCGAYGNNMPADEGDCEDCVKVVKTMKTVSVPCHRNEYKQYTVKVPRQVTVNVPRQEKWTDYETRTKCVPFKDFKTEKRIKYMNQKITVPDVKCVTKMVKVTRKVPKTIYVDLTTQEPKQETIHGTKTITKTIKIPYEAQVPYTNFKNVTYKVPVQKSKMVMDKVQKTVFETQTRTRCEPKVTMVKKQIPVYNVVAKPPAPCAPDSGMGGGAGLGMASGSMAMASGSMQAGSLSAGGMQASGMHMQASGMQASGMQMQASGMEASGMQASGMQMEASGMQASGMGMEASGMQMEASGMDGHKSILTGNLTGDLGSSGAGLQSSGAGLSGASGYGASGGGGGAISGELQTEFNALDLNNDGMLSPQEYASARNAGPSMNQGSGYGSGMASGMAHSGMAASGGMAQSGMASSAMQASSSMMQQGSSMMQQSGLDAQMPQLPNPSGGGGYGY